MRAIKIGWMALALAAACSQAGELSEADQRWADVVREMAAERPRTISTPSRTRAELAEAIGRELGKKTDLVFTERGYRISFSNYEQPALL